MIKLISVLLLAAGGAATFAPINTTSGQYIGHTAPITNDVIEYLGIRYAQPAVGELRFSSPTPYTSSETVEATAFSPDCPFTPANPVAYPNKTAHFDVIFQNFTSQNRNPQSEDCLALNIWSKNSGHVNKPVLLWIHGGRFTIGGSNNVFYKGQYLANSEDVVVVTINYRLNVFGFPGSPLLQSPNVGLLDQRLAIEWVHSNIAAFGGDPSRINVFGQSAGGVAVDYMAYAYPDNPLVAGLISHSGTAFSFEPNTPETSAHYFYNLSSLVGCGDITNTSDGDILACMRTIPAPVLLNATALLQPLTKGKATASPLFHPTVDNITVFSLAGYNEMAANGSFAPVPYLAGNNDNEAGYYKISAFTQHINLTDEQWNIFNLEGFTCATAHAVSARVSAGDHDTWRYRYLGDWDNLRLYPGSGAYHGSDLTLVFGTTFNLTGAPDSEAEAQYGAYLQRAWAAFARDPHNGLADQMGWPRYSDAPGAKTLIALAYNNSVMPAFVDPAPYDAECAALGGDVQGTRGSF